jgi:hypothetical protein
MPTVTLAAEEIVAQWRRTADPLAGLANPAGPLYVSGRYAEADILTAGVGTGNGTGRCGTDCSGSTPISCC